MLNSTLLVGQPLVDLLEYQNKYPDKTIINLDIREQIDIQIKDGALAIKFQSYEEDMLLRKQAISFNQGNVSYSGWDSLVNISARVLVPYGKKYKTVKVKEFKTNDVLEGSVFHNDVKEKTFRFNSLTTGAKRIVEYEKYIKEPRFIPGFYFGTFSPTEKSSYVITCPSSVKLEFKYFWTDAEKTNFKKEEKNGIIRYSWELNNIEELENESGSPGIRHYMPHIITYISEYTINGEKKKLLSGVSDLHSWYRGFVHNLNEDPCVDLEEIVDSITKGITDEKEIVRRVFYWVEDNIKYVAIEDGLGGFIPREANLVHKRRFGDCKDMSSIISEMLQIAEVPSFLTWIGTREIPYRYEEVPTPAVDNHMLVAYKLDDEFIFLDATGRHIPFGYPSSFIQGKEGLISYGDDSFEVVKVPEVPAEKNLSSTYVEMSLGEKNIVKGKSIQRFNGYHKMFIEGWYEGIEQSERKKYLTGFYEMGNNTFQLDTIYEEGLYNRDEDLVVNLDFHLKDYYSVNADEIYFNMHVDRSEYEEVLKDRKLPIQRRFKTIYERSIILNIPEGYEVNFVPENKSFENKTSSFKFEYKLEKEKVSLSSYIKIDHLLLEKDQFEMWNNMIEEMNSAYSEVLILKKIP